MPSEKLHQEQQAAPVGVVGVVGLGPMGLPIALALQDAGFAVTATSRSETTRRAGGEAGVGAVAGNTRRLTEEVLRQTAPGSVPIVLTSLPAGPQVHETVLGQDGVLETAGDRPMLVVDTSTCAPRDTRELASELANRGSGLIDAPVSGGPTAARSGTLAVMVGGAAPDRRRAEPVLQALAGRLVHCGDSGAGQVAKACNQLVVASTIGVVAEALCLAAHQGADPSAVREALLGGYAESRILHQHGQRMLEHDFSLGGSARNQVKDIDIIRNLTTDTDQLTIFQAAAEVMENLVANGGADLDHSAAVTVIERRLGIDLKRAVDFDIPVDSG